MESLKIAHSTNTTNGTGLSVFLFDRPAVAAYTLAGAAPATHEIASVDYDATVPFIDALMLTGGSAFGLNASAGILLWLKEQGRGLQTPFGSVPIVPAVGLFDLGVKSNEAPTPEEAYQACMQAKERDTQQGRIGAGTGASVGKLIPQTSCMSGGLGFAETILPNGLHVLAYAAVNSVGEVRDKFGKVIAGARLKNGEFANTEEFLMTGQPEAISFSQNTSLIAVFTNAKFSRIELKRISKVAIAGMARAIYPAFTCYDGDILFTVSLGDHIASELMVGSIAAEMVRQAIVNAVHDSIVLA